MFSVIFAARVVIEKKNASLAESRFRKTLSSAVIAARETMEKTRVLPAERNWIPL